MKKLTILFALVMATAFAFAQEENENDEIRTVFSNRKSNGAYGAVSMGYSQIDGQDALITGARGAFIVDRSFAIGLGGYGFVNNLDYRTYVNTPLDYYLAGGYGGVFLEPIVGGTHPVHFSFPVLFGLGGVALIEDYGFDHWDHHPFNDLDHDVFFVIEPAVEVEFNLTRFFRTAAFASYRHTSGIDLFETNPEVLRGFNFGLTFKFGKF